MIEYRWVGEHDQLPFVGAELWRLPVAVLISTAGVLAAMAAKAAVPSSPVIFSGTDPVPLTCYNRSCGNTIGLVLTEALELARLNLLRDVAPRAATIGVLLKPNFPPAAGQLRDMEEAARALDVQLQVLRASSDREIDVLTEVAACPRTVLRSLRHDIGKPVSLAWVGRQGMSALTALLKQLAVELNARQPIDIPRYFTDDFRLDDAGAGLVISGPNSAQRMVDMLLANAPDVRYTMLDAVESADRVAVRWRVTGTRDAGPFDVAMMALYRFVDGRIAEDWGVWSGKPWQDNVC